MKKAMFLSKIALAASVSLALAFTLFACSSDDGDDSNYDMLNGVWDRGDIVVTFTDDKGVFTQVKSGVWLTILNNGEIRIGDPKFRNIKQKDDFTWTCQQLCQEGSSASGWYSTTIAMDRDGQTIRATVTDSGCTGSDTYTKE